MKDLTDKEITKIAHDFLSKENNDPNYPIGEELNKCFKKYGDINAGMIFQKHQELKKIDQGIDKLFYG